MKGLFTAAALSLALASPAAATIITVDASSIQGDNVLFNEDEVKTGTMVTGATKSGTAVNFTGMTVGGGNVIQANGGGKGGQARVEGGPNTGTNNPNDTLTLSSLSFGLATGTFTNLEFGIFGGTKDATASFSITDNMGEVFNFNEILGAGLTFFGFQGIDGQSIRTVDVSVVGGFGDIRQVRLDQVQTTAVPGPIAGAGLPVLMALGGLVWARRRKTSATA